MKRSRVTYHCCLEKGRIQKEKNVSKKKNSNNPKIFISKNYSYFLRIFKYQPTTYKSDSLLQFFSLKFKVLEPRKAA